ncbi:MAG: hypothetical protein ACKVW3_00890, partial [Phycisphaerales bacterium]
MPASLFAGCLAFATLMIAPPAADGQWTVTYLHPQGASRSDVRAIYGATAGGNARLTPKNWPPVLWDVSSQGLISFGPPNSIGTIFAMTATQQAGELGSRASIWSGTP